MKKVYFLIMALFINSVVLSQSQLPATATKDWLNSLTDENGKLIMSNTGRFYSDFMENGAIPDLTMTGEEELARFGYSVSSAGDVNGDGFSDVIVSAYSQDRVYIFFGDASMNNTADVILTGEEANSYFGYSVSSAGDVNGDGFSDVIVGAFKYSSVIGKAYIFFGGTSMNNTADVIITGESTSQFGISVSSAGDVNGDGFSDVIVGALWYSSGIGRAYIFFGGASMNNTADVIMTGESVNYFGHAVSSAGDVNGDGFSDVIVGGFRYSEWRGRACIFFGGVSMDNTADVIMIGGQAYNYFGISVSSAGDVNNDGYSDVIVGEHAYSSETGRAHIFYGGTSMNNTADVIMTGEDVNSYFGYSVSSAGDVNGDGYSDVIVGANAYSSYTGKAYVFFGSQSMNNTADVILTGEAAGSYYGHSVSSAGDVNGDGYSDVIVGAYGYSSEAGRAYVYSEGLIEHLNDVGVSSIVQPGFNSIYNFDCVNGSTIIPVIKVSNFGSNDQLNNFDVFCEIKQGNNLVYFSSKQDTISGQQSHMLSFDPYIITPYSYDEDLTRTYSIISWTSLSTDVNRYNDTTNSSFKALNPNYGYSDASGYYFLNSEPAASCILGQPSYSWEDTTGSVSLIVNAQPVVHYTDYNSFYFCGSFRLPDVLPNGRKFKFFGTCYDTIIIADNGVIGFGNASLSRMNVPFPEAIPSANAPHPAIFPLWYWVNFQDPEITGRNLKYKVTDEKVIITYDRVPLYNATIDANDYVTYQVILETEVDCSQENGNIKVQYNYDKSGSTFINNYNNNALNEMTVGLQNSTGTIALQYRRSEANHSVNVPGPLFGSPLAVEFAPVNSVLPVDLQTFTSSVNNNNVILNWSLNSELNNSGFEIQRRKSESEWIKINFVNGRGSSSEPYNYSYEDKNLYAGKYEYRLKQIDYNGSFKYYDLQNEVVIGIPEKFRLDQNYPNPFNPVTKIDFDIPMNSKISLIVYDVSGREIKKLVNEIKEAGYYSVNFDGTNLASGVYFYSLLINGNVMDTKRMILLK